MPVRPRWGSQDGEEITLEKRGLLQSSPQRRTTRSATRLQKKGISGNGLTSSNRPNGNGEYYASARKGWDKKRKPEKEVYELGKETGDSQKISSADGDVSGV